ncbi:MAG TPA: SMC family ATPase [Longilinea sp.]|nr:SMC family ATPase [Longilinea sp.]
MIPIRLRISGFLSYIEPVEIDFTGFNLACISGANGAGKSSLLDAITWVLFGEARLKDDADAIINSSSTVKEAQVILEFEYEGLAYKVIRTRPRKKTSQLEFMVADAQKQWKTLTESTMSKTEESIRNTLRLDYRTFTNASFFLQGKADQFSQQKSSDRKHTLFTVLGLEQWEGYKNRTADKRKEIDRQQAINQGRLQEIEQELAQEPERKAALETAQKELAAAEETRKSKETTLEGLQRLAASLAEQKKLVDLVNEQYQRSQQERVELVEKIASRRVEHDLAKTTIAQAGAIQTAFDAWQQTRKELERWDGVARNFHQYEAQRQEPLREIERERARMEQEIQGLVTEEAKVSEISAVLPERKAALENAQRELAVTQSALEKRSSIEVELRSANDSLGQMRAEYSQLKRELKEIEELIERLKGVSGSTCPFCGQPLTADDRERHITDLNAQYKEKTENVANSEAEGKRVRTVCEQLEKDLGALKNLETLLAQQKRSEGQEESFLQRDLTIVNDWQTSGGPRLALLKAKLAEQDFALEARTQLAQVDASLKELGYDSAAHDAVRQAELAGRSSEEKIRQVAAAQAALAGLEREVKELEAQLKKSDTTITAQEKQYHQALDKYEAEAASLPDMRQMEDELMTLREAENMLRLKVGQAHQSVNVLAELSKQQTKFCSQQEELMQRSGRYKTLERAFSKDGLPAMLIEQALPEIEQRANDILERLSSGSMNVRFATQKAYKDKNREDQKETLDIIISDALGERPYELFSGGEAFRVNFAIRMALSHLLAQRAGARLQTLVIDEGFGSQDVEGRQRLIEAINMVQPDFAKILVITHLEELKEAFPARLEVTKTVTGSQVKVFTG